MIQSFQSHEASRLYYSLYSTLVKMNRLIHLSNRMEKEFNQFNYFLGKMTWNTHIDAIELFSVQACFRVTKYELFFCSWWNTSCLFGHTYSVFGIAVFDLKLNWLHADTTEYTVPVTGASIGAGKDGAAKRGVALVHPFDPTGHPFILSLITQQAICVSYIGHQTLYIQLKKGWKWSLVNVKRRELLQSTRSCAPTASTKQRWRRAALLYHSGRRS